jgi:hypothetical protein
MTDEVRRLAECKNCGVLFRESNTAGGCSNCGHDGSDEEDVVKRGLDGELRTYTESWYRRLDIVARRVE